MAQGIQGDAVEVTRPTNVEIVIPRTAHAGFAPLAPLAMEVEQMIDYGDDDISTVLSIIPDQVKDRMLER